MSQRYVGIHHDQYAGMTPTGTLIRDAWVFGIIPETQDCAGWDNGMLQNLFEKVYQAWEAYGHLPSRLPLELRTRHEQIYAAAIQKARLQAWNPELNEDD